jgi:uroporphyrinogen-III decarboxylase
MRTEIKRRFPGRNIGQVDDHLPPDLITGLYGIAVVPAMFGQSIQYFQAKWPQPYGEPLTDAQADSLQPPQLDNNDLFQDILGQIDTIQQLTGAARGYLNWQGVLNTAFRLRGQRIFMDLFDAPQRAHHIFQCVTATMIEGIRKLHLRQKQAGVEEKFATISNCVVNMIGPEHYSEFILPYDLKIRAEFEKFGIHNCAWLVDPYMDAYATVPRLGYLDMGITSNLKRAKQLFPQTRRTVLYTSMDLANKSEDQIYADFERIAQDFAPCDVGLPDIEIDVPDERVIFAMELCKKLTDKYGE